MTEQILKPRPSTRRVPAKSASVETAPNSVLIAIPLYRGAELIPGLLDALHAISGEIQRLSGQVLLINDSPGDGLLDAALDEHLPRLREMVSTEILTNAENIGFVRSANRALELARNRGADVILLNSDAIPVPGAFAEMAAVAQSDPMISVVSPRSNNATICNSPYLDSFRSLAPVEALRSHQAVARYLPRVTYVPTAVGFCLYIRNLMLREFGVFDEVYDQGYNEENDFIMRCNQKGYRAALANHAFVHHVGKVSFAKRDPSPEERELETRRILLDRYPHYLPSVSRYFGGAEYLTQRLLAGLAPDPNGRLRILIDCRNLGLFHSGTFELTRALLKALAETVGLAFSLHIACRSDVAVFHGLDQIDNAEVVDPDDLAAGPFAVAFRIAQPFKPEQVAELCALAPVTGFLFLDAIAMDCLHLDTDDFDNVWRWMAQNVDLLGFISNFSSEQFKRRFGPLRDVVEFVSLCSTDVGEYRHASVPGEQKDAGVLVVGNHYAHKHVAETVAAIRRRTGRPLTVIGTGLDDTSWDAVVAHRAGELEQVHVDALYEGAEFVVFPSHYEGFGLPIMHALARGKPVIARDLPPSREIKLRCGDAVNLHLYRTTDEIAEAVAAGVSWRAPDTGVRPHTWADAAEAVLSAMTQAIQRCDYARLHARTVRLQTPRAGVAAVAEPADHQLPQTHDLPQIDVGSSDEATDRPTEASPELVDRQAEVAALRAAQDAGLAGMARRLQYGVRRLLGASRTAAAVSWTIRARLNRSGLFDPRWYLEQYRDVADGGWDPLAHYVRHGFAEGRFPNPMFDTHWYLAVNSDVRSQGINPLLHYACSGEREGRRPVETFDPALYVANNMEAANCRRGALFHFLHHGGDLHALANPVPIVEHSEAFDPRR